MDTQIGIWYQQLPNEGKTNFGAEKFGAEPLNLNFKLHSL